MRQIFRFPVVLAFLLALPTSAQTSKELFNQWTPGLSSGLPTQI